MNAALFLALTAFAGAIFQAFQASATIEGTPHDLSFKGKTIIASCEYCHPRHGRDDGDDGLSPAWITEEQKGEEKKKGFGLYDAGPPAGGLGPTSLICLGCHDGAIAKLIQIDLQGSLDEELLMLRRESALVPSAFFPGDSGASHPVGFKFVENGPQAGHGVPMAVFKPPFGVDLMRRGFTIYGDEGTFECTTCHDPHNNLSGQTAKRGSAECRRSCFFLRAPRASICSDCHLYK